MLCLAVVEELIQMEKEKKKEKKRKRSNKQKASNYYYTLYARQDIYKTVIAFHLVKLIHIKIGGFKKEKK